MHNNSDRRVPRIHDRVDLDDGSEVEYWCRDFGCTESELRSAVAEAGTLAPRVRQKIHVRRVRRLLSTSALR